MVGILLSFWEGLFLGAMLVSGRVSGGFKHVSGFFSIRFNLGKMFIPFWTNVIFVFLHWGFFDHHLEDILCESQNLNPNISPLFTL